MHRDALRTLAVSGLPYLNAIPTSRPSDVDALPNDLYVHSKHGSTPGRVGKSELRRLLATGTPEQYTVVEFTESWGGATCIRRGDLVYIEFVYGHLSGLLRSAALSRRILLRAGRSGASVSEVRPCDQRTFIDPLTMSATARSVLPSEPHDIESFSTEVANMVLDSSLPNDYLSELMATSGGPVWIDAKPFSWDIKYESLFDASSNIVYRGNFIDLGDVAFLSTASWSPDDVPTNTSGYGIVLDERPLTCHFVTYAIERGLTVIYNWSPENSKHSSSTELPRSIATHESIT